MASLETQLAEGNQSSIYKSEGGCVEDTRIGPGLTAVIFKTQTIEQINGWRIVCMSTSSLLILR